MSVVLVPGCSSGSGLETAFAFSRRGDAAYATLRDVSRSERLERRAVEEQLSFEILPLEAIAPRRRTSMRRAESPVQPGGRGRN